MPLMAGGPARFEHRVSSMKEAGLADLGWQGSKENQTVGQAQAS